MKIDGLNVLVTGGAGLIGSHLVDQLLRKNCNVTILDNLEEQTHPNGKPKWIPSDVRFIHGDIRNSDDVTTALEGVEVVFHQAAFGGFTSEVSKYFDSNVTGTARLLEGIRRKKSSIKKLVAASSQAVYGEGAYHCKVHKTIYPEMRQLASLKEKQWEHPCPHCGQVLKSVLTCEEKPVMTLTPYGISKYAEERMTIGFGQTYGIPAVALRYGVTFGPRQSIFNPYTGVVSIFSTRLLNNLPPVIYEDGCQMRDFIYVEDVARANIFVAESESTDYQAFNVSRGIGIKVKDLTLLLSKLYQRDFPPLIRGEFRPQDVRHLRCSSEKLEKLGFCWRTELEDGIKKYIEWVRTQGDIKEYFSQAESILKKSGVVHSI